MWSENLRSSITRNIFNAQNPGLIKSLITSDSGMRMEARRVFFCSLASEPIWGEAEASGNLGEGSKPVTRPKVPTSKLQFTLLAPLLTSPYSSMATQSSLPQALCTGCSFLWGGPAVCLLVHLAGSHSLSKFSAKYGLISKVHHTPLPSKRSPHQILSEILSLASKH